MIKTATISSCGKYRYLLTRQWDKSIKPLIIIMLNPSTADALKDDPTIRRCISFADQCGYGGISVMNLFALRSTSPKVLWSHSNPVGPENQDYLASHIKKDDDVLAAWGSIPHNQSQDIRVMAYLKKAKATVRCLGVTKGGYPRHPLYVANDVNPIPYYGRII
jgi:hypothetical protein